ncbi:hypothetical protein C8R44DRAFT_873810 [Mycena epipterygia]|nr:hypothetical protein C8R44DRAFT_873810 [Mycena epipterygia]
MFRALLGILIGDTSSPILWTLYLSDFKLLSDATSDILLAGIFITNLEQADDVILISLTAAGAQRKMDALYRCFSPPTRLVHPDVASFRDAEEGEGSTGGDDEDEDEDEDLPAMITVSAAPDPRRARPWLPIKIKDGDNGEDGDSGVSAGFPTIPITLAGGTISRPLGKPARRSRVVSEEGLYMELLAGEYNNEEPDAGALEGFGDDFGE